MGKKSAIYMQYVRKKQHKNKPNQMVRLSPGAISELLASLRRYTSSVCDSIKKDYTFNVIYNKVNKLFTLNILNAQERAKL